MIKNILATTLVLNFIQVHAQNIVFSENFNSGSIPVNFTTYDLDLNTVSPMLTTFFPNQASFNACSYFGFTFAGSPSLFTSNSTADKWMVTPAITLSNNSDLKTLRFDASAGDVNSRDGIEIYVSLGNSPVDFLSSTALYNSTGIGEPYIGNGWANIEVDISAYSGQTIHIGFRNNNYNEFVIGIDNIEVIEQSVISNVNDEIIDRMITNSNNRVVKMTNLLGVEIKKKKNQPLFYIYDDGTVEKKIILE
jgi:hypothetical protein